MGRACCILLLAMAAQAQPPTFVHDVAPILYQHCAPCHRPGEAGPFSLLSYADAKKRAAQIAAVTSSRYMPPWLPEPDHGDFADELRLSESQIDTLARWVSQGMPEGDPAGLPPAPR